jgi:hypothetical protein
MLSVNVCTQTKRFVITVKCGDQTVVVVIPKP